MLQKLGLLAIGMCCICLPATVQAAAPVAVFPLQELGKGRNDVNLPFTRLLTERLASSGNEVSTHETVIAFMANNRIRTAGYLETFHVSRARDDLGAAFVLLGTVSQRKEHPQPSLGLTLQLVRTSDARTIWSYVGHLSTGDDRRVMGIGEPRSVADLQQLLLEDLLARWPWETVREVQMAGVISLDSIILQPAQVRPGGEVNARVRLRNIWLPGRAPRIFFRADDQLHAARTSADGGTYEANWIAGEKDGRFPVTLVLEWPLYGRSETALLGNYVVDGMPPLFEIELRGVRLLEDIPVFSNELIILPRLLVRKPLERWRLAFVDSTGQEVGADAGVGNLPEFFVWQGHSGSGEMLMNGQYQVVLEAWDRAGNLVKTVRQVAIDRSLPMVELAVARNDREMVVDLEHIGKVPLDYWRMEMWTKEGKLLSETEGRQLPAQVAVDLPAADQDAEIKGYVVLRDVLGNRTRRKVEDLLPKIDPKAAAAKEEKPASASEKWVDEF